MAVPKRKTSKMKGRKRRTHYKAQAPALSVCPRCRTAVRPHTVCASCGWYRGREVVKVVTAAERAAAKKSKEEGSPGPGPGLEK